MALLSEVGTFTSPAATGNQTVSLDSGIWGGESPKVVLFWGNAFTADGVGAHARNGFGVAISSSSRASIAVFSLDAAATSDSSRRHDNTKCIILMSNATTVSETADFVSFGANEFTINWTTADTAAFKYNFMVLGGDDLTDVYLDEITSPASTGNQAYTGVGFQPDSLIAFGISYDTAPAVTVQHSLLSLGVSSGSGTDRSVAMSSKDGVATSITNRLAVSSLISSVFDDAVRDEASVVSLDSDGYTLNWGYGISGEYHFVLCLKGPQVKVLTGDQPATDTTAVRTIGFTPKAALALTHMGAGTGFSDDVPSGFTGQSYKFDGENDYIKATSNFTVRTVSLWAQPHSLGVFRLWSASSNENSAFINSSGDLQGYYNSNKIANTELAAMSVGTWAHVVITHDGTDSKIYIDGTEVQTETQTTDDASKSFAVGALSSGGQCWQGKLYDVRVYSDGLTANEVTWLFSNGVSGTDPTTANLTLHWELNGDFTDSSASANDGILNGEVNDDARIGIGGWDSSNNMAFAGAVDEDGQATTNADRIQDSNEAIKHIDHLQTVVGSMSAAASGNTLVETWTDTDGTQREHVMIVFGDAAAAGGGGGGLGSETVGSYVGMPVGRAVAGSDN